MRTRATSVTGSGSVRSMRRDARPPRLLETDAPWPISPAGLSRLRCSRRRARSRFDLKSALDAVVALRAEVPDDAFTASILGTERTGNGVVIRDDGLVLTIGYLITEAASVWLTANDGAVVQGHPLAYDFATGFGLVLPLGRLDAAGRSRAAPPTSVAEDDDVYVIGHGGRAHALKATVFAKREFAGYWEYLLDDGALHDAAASGVERRGAARRGRPPDRHRLAAAAGESRRRDRRRQHVRADRPARADPRRPACAPGARRSRRGRGSACTPPTREGRLVVNGLATGGPAERAGVHAGDLVVAVGGERVGRLAELFRADLAAGPGRDGDSADAGARRRAGLRARALRRSQRFPARSRACSSRAARAAAPPRRSCGKLADFPASAEAGATSIPSGDLS